MHRHGFTQGRIITGIAASALLLTGLAGVPAVSAADEPAPNGAVAPAVTSSAAETRTAPAKRKPIPQGQCARNGGVLGLASVAGKRLEGGTVSVLTKPSRAAKGWFTKAERLKGTAKTNAAGGFFVRAGCLPEYFVVTVTGGTLDGEPFTGTISTLGRASEPAVIVTPVTTVAVQYARSHRGASPVKVARLVKKHFDLVDYGAQLVDLGMGSRVISSAFDPAAFMAAVEREGGLAAFAKKSIGRIGSGKVRSFAPTNFVPKQRPGYEPAPDGPSDDVTVTQAGALRPRGGVSSALSSIAGKAMVGETCELIGPSMASDLAGVCPTDYSSALDAINQSLISISKQLDELQESVDEIIDMLNVMEQQLTDIQTSLNTITQMELKSAAQAAQQAYATAYNYSSATEVSNLVNSAVFDVVILGSLPLQQEDTWPIVGVSATVADKCSIVYSKYNITSGEYAGQNPLALCEDYHDRVAGFADNNSYNIKLYKSLTGASSTPVGDLLVYQQQQALTSGAYAPVAQETLKESFDQMGQLGQLMDIGYAMLAAWQTFDYAVTTGEFASCPNLTVSGSFPANTTINTSSACNTLQSGLFSASVQNQIAGKAALPPAGSVADPRNNYVWWGYPVDVSGTTYTSKTFPFYPTSDGSNPYNTVFNFAKGIGSDANTYGYLLQALRGTMYYQWTSAAQPLPLIAGYSAADFAMPTTDQMLTLFSNLPMSSGQTYASALGSLGFRGVGGTSYGVNWKNLASDTHIEWLFSKYPNQPWTSNAAGAVGTCQGWPWASNKLFAFDWQVSAPSPGSTVCSGFLPIASRAWNLASTTAPTSSNATACPITMQNSSKVSVTVCSQDTFALLVNDQYRSPTATSGGWTPPFYTPAMLNGPSSSGVPALPLS